MVLKLDEITKIILIPIILIVLLAIFAIATVNLESPAADVWTSSDNDTLAFQFNITAADGLATGNVECNLTLNGAVVGTNSSVVNDTTTTLYSDTAFTSGANTWYVNCSNSTDTNVSVTRIFYYDVWAPAPTGASLNATSAMLNTTNTTVIQINITATDVGAGSTSTVTVGNGTAVSMTNTSGVWQTNKTPAQLGCGPEGICTLTFNATDNVSNSNTSVTVTIGIDETAPAVTSAAVDDSYVKSTQTVQFNVTVTDTSTISTVYLNTSTPTLMTSIGSNKYQANATPAAFGCTSGTCIAKFTATDQPGNINNTETITITVDNIPPAVTNPARNTTSIKSSDTVQINVTATDANMSTVTVGNGGTTASMTNVSGLWQVNTTGTLLGCTSSGNCTLTFNATDEAGNSNTTTTTWINVDNGAPSPGTPSLNSSAATRNVTNTTVVQINITSDSDTASLTVGNGTLQSMTNIGGTNWQANYTPAQLGCGPEGSCTLHFNATDNNANSNTSVTATIYIDETGPAVTLLSKNPAEVKSTGTFQFNATVIDTSTIASVMTNNSMVMSLLTGNVYSNNTLTPTALGCAANAVCTLGITATDVPGNVNSTETTTITVDDTAPTVTFIYNSTNVTSSSTSVTLNITVVDANTEASATANNASMTQIGATNTWYVTATPAEMGCSEGTCTITYNGTDTAGNVGQTTSTITVDDTGPAVTGASVTNATTAKNATVVNVQVTASDAVSSVSSVTVNGNTMYLLSGNTYHANRTGVQLGCGPDGVCTLTFNATDTYGNSNTTVTTTYTIDTTAPTNTSTFSASGTSSGATVSATMDEAAKCTVIYGTNTSVMGSSANSSSFSTTASISISGLSASTTYYYNITNCWDTLGNSQNLNLGPSNFTTSAASTPTGGGGGGGGSVTVTSTIALGDMTGGQVAMEMGRGNIMQFNHDSQEHHIKLTGLGTTYADFEAQSILQSFRLLIGQSKNIDLDADAKPDINVKLENILSTKAAVKLTSLSATGDKVVIMPPGTYDRTSKQAAEEGNAEADVVEEAAAAEQSSTTKAGAEDMLPESAQTETAEEKSKAPLLTGIIVIAVIALVLGLVAWRRKKKQ